MLESSKKKGLVLLLVLALGGCASSGNRDYESMTPVENERSPIAATLPAIAPVSSIAAIPSITAVSTALASAPWARRTAFAARLLRLL